MAGKAFDKPYPSQFDKVKEITDKLEAGIQALFESEAFKNYLKTLSKFHDYSLNNTILIAMQKPDDGRRERWFVLFKRVPTRRNTIGELVELKNKMY